MPLTVTNLCNRFYERVHGCPSSQVRLLEPGISSVKEQACDISHHKKFEWNVQKPSQTLISLWHSKVSMA